MLSLPEFVAAFGPVAYIDMSGHVPVYDTPIVLQDQNFVPVIGQPLVLRRFGRDEAWGLISSVETGGFGGLYVIKIHHQGSVMDLLEESCRETSL